MQWHFQKNSKFSREREWDDFHQQSEQCSDISKHVETTHGKICIFNETKWTAKLDVFALSMRFLRFIHKLNY